MNNETTKFLQVSEMGVETGTPQKTLKVTELPEKETPQEQRKRRIDDNLTTLMAGGFAGASATEAIRNILYMEKAVAALDSYDGWKNIAFFLAGKLSAKEKELLY